MRSQELFAEPFPLAFIAEEIGLVRGDFLKESVPLGVVGAEVAQMQFGPGLTTTHPDHFTGNRETDCYTQWRKDREQASRQQKK